MTKNLQAYNYVVVYSSKKSLRKVYCDAEIKIYNNISKSEAENLLKHIDLVYNTFGMMMKDLIKVVSYKYSKKEVEKTQTNIFPKVIQKPELNNAFNLLKK